MLGELGLGGGTLLVIVACFVIAGAVKGTVGIGLPTVAVGLLSQIIDPRLTVSLVALPIFLTNLYQVWSSGVTLETARRYWVMGAVLVVALWGATFLTASVSSEVLLGVIGVAVVTFAATNLFLTPPPLPERHDRAGQVAAGIGAGVFGGLTSIWSPPVVTYLIARGTGKDEFVRATGLMFALGGVPLVLGFWQQGLLDGGVWKLGALLTLPSIAGFALGEVLRRRLDAERFRRLLLWTFLLLGLNLLRKVAFG